MGGSMLSANLVDLPLRQAEDDLRQDIIDHCSLSQLKTITFDPRKFSRRESP